MASIRNMMFSAIETKLSTDSGRTVDTEDSLRASLVESCSRSGYFGLHLRSCFALSNKAGAPEGCMTVKTQLESLSIKRSQQDGADATVDGWPCKTVSPSERRRQVSFGTVEFRSYPIILGDNPSTTSGPPLTIGWQHDPEETVASDLDTYEECLPARRSKTELRIPPFVREEMLLLTGLYSKFDLHSAVKLVKKDRDRRIKTAVRNQRLESISSKIGSARCAFSRINCLRNVSVYPRPDGKRDSLLLKR